MSEENKIIDFEIPKLSPSIIMVTGVGGGGSNAVNHMYELEIADVSFMVCNTDPQALRNSPVPVKVRLGQNGLGAGNNPEKGRQAALESLDEIIEIYKREGTKMVFTGDIQQIDSPYLDAQSNGLAYMIDKMKGQDLFAHINLIKGERSELSELASDLL